MEPSFSVLTNGSRWGLGFRNSFMIMSWRLTIGTPSHTQNMFRISIILSPKFLQQKPQFRECRERERQGDKRKRKKERKKRREREESKKARASGRVWKEGKTERRR